MRDRRNELRWDGRPGHYEVYYLTLTDRHTGVGIWIRYTMVAPVARTGEPASAALWFLAMDPRPGRRGTIARKATFPIDQLDVGAKPFELRLSRATLTNARATGAFDDVAWDLHYAPSALGYQHVHPVLERLGAAQTLLELPHADLSIAGSISFGGERLELAGARGAQAHLWGSKHARSWAWMHCNDFDPLDAPTDGAFIDAVSAVVSRFGRPVGPITPVLARIDGADFRSISPHRVVTNPSTFTLTGWRLEAVDRGRKLVAEVDADRDLLVGVTYHDPDGQLAYCYNTETASIRLRVYERAPRVGGWALVKTLVARGRAHFEYAQRTPIPDLELHTT